MWKTGKNKLEEQCKEIERENEAIKTKLASVSEEEQEVLRDCLSRNQALLTGKEICLQHMNLSELMKEREKSKERNPLFW